MYVHDNLAIFVLVVVPLNAPLLTFIKKKKKLSVAQVYKFFFGITVCHCEFLFFTVMFKQNVIIELSSENKGLLSSAGFLQSFSLHF